jgi:hypothetical protein
MIVTQPKQWFEAPTVYLDHWAWMDISGSSLWMDRFSSALESRKGTLAISNLNLLEFSTMTDQKQPCRADQLRDRIFPQIAYINPNFIAVIEEEDKLTAADPKEPHADSVTLNDHVHAKFCLVHQTGTATKFLAFADFLIKDIETRRQNNQRYSFAGAAKGKSIRRGTRFIADELLGAVCKNKKLKLNRQHVIDICHAIVPVAYCDFVLLDGCWRDQVERAQRRIRDRGMKFPMAQIFSKHGVDDFLTALESGRNGSGGSMTI